jgi:hypothetical protein
MQQEREHTARTGSFDMAIPQDMKMNMDMDIDYDIDMHMDTGVDYYWTG